MFLGAYHFDGDTAPLLDAYERLIAQFPPGATDLHVCVTREGGITVFDACPSWDVFQLFSSGPDFRSAVETAGLPSPRVEPVGEVHRAKISGGVG